MKVLLLIVAAAICVSAEHNQLLEAFRAENVLFSGEIYNELQKTTSNNFLASPLSLQIVLALLQGGAKGNTADELAHVLHLPETSEKIHETYAQLSSSLHGNEDYELESANKIYVRNGFEINDQYKSTAVDVFQADIQSVDFTKTEETATEINDWVQAKTRSNIKDMIQADALGSETVAILVNALYFHGEWVNRFPQYATKTGTFHLNHKDHVEVEIMDMLESVKYYEDSEANVKHLQLAYQGDDVTMNIVLPNDKEGLAAIQSRITDFLVEPHYEQRYVHVKLPKFVIEAEIKFNPILQALGVKDAFDQSTADFTGIGSQASAQDSIFISAVLQKTFIDVQEDGTTAAAATIVLMRDSSLPIDPKTFHADHPFIFYLKSRAGILFVGRYVGK